MVHLDPWHSLVHSDLLESLRVALVRDGRQHLGHPRGACKNNDILRSARASLELQKGTGVPMVNVTRKFLRHGTELPITLVIFGCILPDLG